MKTKAALLIITSTLFVFHLFAQDQPRTPDVMSTGTMEEQMEYLQQRTNIYNNFRAIREDIFLKMKKNTLDSLAAAKKEIIDLEKRAETIKKEKDSLNSLLGKTREELDDAVENRDNLVFFGIPMNKILYNTIMWGIVLGLSALLVMLMLLYKRNSIITRQTRKEITGIKEEFEAYRKSNREKMEKMVVDHFNEMKKLKGG